MLLLCAVLCAILIYLGLLNFASIKEYIRWRIMIEKLPKIVGKKFLIGHAAGMVGVSNEETWLRTRKWLAETPFPLSTFYLGPTVIIVTVVGAEEIEAMISSMKNLQKAEIYDFLHEWLDNGLLTSTGPHWQARRKILTPAFHFSILREFLDIFTKETANLVKEIEKKCLNKSTDITSLISDFTLLTINETSMGTKLDTRTVEGLTYKQGVYAMADNLYTRIMSPWYHHKKIYYNSPKGRKEKKLVKNMHDFTDKIIQNRAERFEVFEEPTDENDGFTFRKRKYPLLDILLNAKFKENSISDQGIREEVNTFMFEGHDTTAMSLMYTCMLLACNKNIQEEVYQETVEVMGKSKEEPTFADIQNMTLLERCIKESLRLYPSVAVIGRKLNCDVPTNYGIVPRGTTCLIHIYDLHRTEKYWPNPEKFDPSRFLPENSGGRHPFAYIPFSAGPRNCIGQRFAMLEMKTALCGLLRKFTLEPVDTPKTIVLTQDMVLRPKNGLKVKFVLRKQ